MAFQYGSWVAPQASSGSLTGIVDAFNDSYKQGQAARQEKDALAALGDYVDTLYGPQTQPVSAPRSAGDNLVYGSVESAMSAEGPMLANYFASTRRSESGGNDAAANPNSSALGRYQFIDSTWSDLMKRHPELGLTADGRTDPAQQEKAIRAFTMDNANTLKGSGIAVNPGSLYAAHFLGPAGASKVLSGAYDSPVSSYVDPQVIEANPFLSGMTVGQFQEWAAGKGGNTNGGYSPPAATQTASATGNGLPPREVMLKLFQNPQTRPMAIELAKAAQAGDTAKAIEINNRLVNPVTGKVIADFSDGSKPLTALGKLKADLDAGIITQAQYDAAVAKETAINGGTTLRVNPATGEVEFQQGGAGGSGMPKLTEQQSKDIVYLTRGAGALKDYETFADSMTSLPETVGGGVPVLGNYLKSPEYQQGEQAGREFLAAILRKDTGAAITKSEEDSYGATYLTRPGDSPAVQAQKKKARERALQALELGIPAPAILEMERRGVQLPGREQPASSAPAQDQGVGEGTIIENDAGERMILQNGQWTPYNG